MKSLIKNTAVIATGLVVGVVMGRMKKLKNGLYKTSPLIGNGICVEIKDEEVFVTTLHESGKVVEKATLLKIL